MRQYFDDGSYLDFASDGVTPLGGVDSSGAAFAPSPAVSQQVFDLLSLGVKSILIGRYGPQTVAQASGPGAQVAPVNPLSQLMPVILLVGGAFLVYKLAQG